MAWDGALVCLNDTKRHIYGAIMERVPLVVFLYEPPGKEGRVIVRIAECSQFHKQIKDMQKR